MPPDEAMVADTAAQFARGRFRSLHRQQRPAAKSRTVLRDRRARSVVEDARRLDRERGIEVIVDKRRRQRQYRAFDAVTLHPLDLLFHVEKRRIETEMHAANIEINRVAFLSLW